MVKNLEELLSMAKSKEKKRLAVAVAEDSHVLEAIMEAKRLGIIEPVLVGNEEKIKNICIEENLILGDVEIINETDNIKAAIKAVKLVNEGKVDFLMKGLLNTSDLLRAVLNKEYGIKKSNVLSHVMLYEVKNYHKLLSLTDGGMIPYPTLEEKVGILKNAIEVAHKLNIENPKVAALCAVEMVNPAMQPTIDAAMLTTMNKRGQIKGCIIDGPLALDNAISKEAAEHKGINSEVSGDADILLVPNIEAGNFLGKSLTYFGGGESAGVIMGAKCPVVLVSRADSAKTKLYSIALGAVIS